MISIGRCLTALSCALPLACAAASTPAASAGQTITRLGWFDMPTPGNASLFDGRDEWTIAMQGTPAVPGEWPRFGRGQRVSHGIGNYGFGCARMTLRVDGEDVLAIVSARALPLRTCRAFEKLRHVEKTLR